jgi:RimJ/RimL family protein N-acetyltransferase
MPHIATTPAKMSDAESFFDLICDKDIRKEFAGFRRIETIEEATVYLEGFIKIHYSKSGNFFKVIRIVFDENTESYDDTNSLLIGFIALLDSGVMDHILTGGFRQNLSFAIKSEYRNKGFMTIALELTLEAMFADTYNLVPALVLPGNFRSARVLEKCGFDKVSQSSSGDLFVKRLLMDETHYKEILGL